MITKYLPLIKKSGVERWGESTNKCQICVKLTWRGCLLNVQYHVMKFGKH